ncbi:unnamed protein product, partial [Brassica oleracea var. botrytis]
QWLLFYLKGHLSLLKCFRLHRRRWSDSCLLFGQLRLLTDFEFILSLTLVLSKFFTAVNYNVFYSIFISLFCIFVNWYLMLCQKN